MMPDAALASRRRTVGRPTSAGAAPSKSATGYTRKKTAGKAGTSITPNAKAASTRRGAGGAGVAHVPASMLTVKPGDLVADTMSVTNRVSANSRCIAVGEDGTVWTGEADGSIAIRLPPLGYEVERIPAVQPRGGRVRQVTVLQRVEDKMWAAYSDGTLRVYATQPNAQGEVPMLSESHQLTAAVHAMCDIGGHVYTAGGDWKIYRWDADDCHYERLFFGHKNTIRALAAYVDEETGEARIASGGDDGTVKIWNPAAPSQTEKDVACVATMNMTNRSGVWSLAVMQDTMELWVGCEDGAIRVYDLYSKLCSAMVEGHTAPVVALRQIDNNVWSGSKSGTLIVVSRYSKEVVSAVKQPASSGRGSAARFSLCIQPVQRTIVNNVWVSNTEGAWQCWSQLSPESIVKASGAGRYRGLNATGGTDESDTVEASKTGTLNGSTGTSVKVTNAHNASSTTAPLVTKDANLRESVASLRRTVHSLEEEQQQQWGEMAAEAEAAGNEVDDQDEDARLDLIEESLRRDRDEALKAADKKVRSSKGNSATRKVPKAAPLAKS